MPTLAAHHFFRSCSRNADARSSESPHSPRLASPPAWSGTEVRIVANGAAGTADAEKSPRHTGSKIDGRWITEHTVPSITSSQARIETELREYGLPRSKDRLIDP